MYVISCRNIYRIMAHLHPTKIKTAYIKREIPNYEEIIL